MRVVGVARPLYWQGTHPEVPVSKTLKIVLLSVLLVDFLAATAFVLWTYGPVGWIPPMVENPATLLAVFDLVIALGIATVWMWTDARSRGVNPWPYLALTATTGSAGPLLYAIQKVRAEG